MLDSPLGQLHAALSQCRRCAEMGYPISSPPIIQHHDGPPMAPSPFLVVGQAPSLTDLRVGRTYQGPAGKRLVEWLLKAGFAESEIGTTVAMTALTKCFPGRLPGKSTDRAPSATELANCRPWLEQELGIVQPRVILPFGKMAIDTFLRPVLPLDQRIGQRFEVDGVTYVPLPHSSGASTWLNHAANLALLSNAIELIARERITQA